MRWSQPLGAYDDEYYEQATFVLVKESPKAIRIKLIDKYRKNYDGLVFWMPITTGTLISRQPGFGKNYYMIMLGRL